VRCFDIVTIPDPYGYHRMVKKCYTDLGDESSPYEMYISENTCLEHQCL
jgi:hypothetical protein